MNIEDVKFSEKLSDSYLNYSIAVIVDRALPDFRDGLKPVARRILYAMYKMHMRKNTPHKKCARIVGEVLGKFHPHGDCLRGNTKVYSLENELFDIKDLIGKEKWVLSFDEKNNRVVPAKAHSFRIGQKTNKIYKIVFYDGSFIETTSNHPLFKINSGWEKAKNIKSGDIIQSSAIFGNEYQIFSYNKKPIYQIVGDFYYDKLKGQVYHHKDKNTLNNEPSNIELISRSEHHSIHNNNSLNALEKGIKTIRSDKYKEANKLKNSELFKLHNKYLFLLKAIKIIKLIKEDGLIPNEDLYSKYRSKIYNGTTCEKLQEKGYSLKTVVSLAENGFKYDTELAKGFTLNLKEDKVIEINKHDTVGWSNANLLKSAILIIIECIKKYGLIFSIEQYELERKNICKKVGKGYGNINNRNFSKFETLRKKLKIENIKDLLTKISERKLAIVKEVIKIKVENESMYDFTVDKYQNMFVPIGKNNKDELIMILVHNSSIYGALVRMARDFALMYPLVDGQGSFGTIDDGAAAMRYTEARLESISELLFNDLDFNTVDFVPNFDSSLEEPVILPARFPNLLVNGASGIAVGMKTDIPCHNLNEIIDGVITLIENKHAVLDDLLKCIKGPDFPTGGLILYDTSKEEIYRTGKGTIKIRAKIEELDVKRRSGLQITELPYGVGKEKVMQQIIKLIKEKKIEGVLDLRDETDCEGTKLVLEFSRKIEYSKIVKKLYSRTKLEDSFSIQFLALDNGSPKLFGLEDFLRSFLNFRIETVKRYTMYKLEEKRKRKNILEGYKKVIDHIENVIKTIRKSNSHDDIRQRLMKRFSLNLEQVNAVMDTKLSKLARFEEDAIRKEIKELSTEIRDLENMLSSDRKILKTIKQDLLDIKTKFGKKRLSKIVKN